MAVIRGKSSLCLAALLSVSIILACPAMAELGNQTGQVTVFWGRHKDEGSLREACDSGMYTGVIMSFLNVHGHGRYHLDLSGHELAGIGDDVKHCQSVGVPVSLSIRGNYSLPSNQSGESALDLSDHIWNAYLAGFRKGVRRPFGDAKLDGVDLFLERGTPAKNYGVLARELAKSNMGGGNRKPIQLTATLPCSFTNNPIDGDVPITRGIYERIHVRFFDNDGHADCNAYSEEVWDSWTAAYPSSRIFLGLPASPEAAKEGYLYPKSLYYGVLPAVQKAANYGGVMLWDRYYDERSNYSSYVKRWA
ncbi:hypothetical protein SEVIR_8G122900v4 [Setaria viridis]|uniref:GH18 domain-containing protein n=1 Tax=Setaria viridis TaxID=4556 RepID=A0A4U6TEK0_SETVI|nr:xylanase inhibitor protein 1-like [Setaria viridis]TKW00621.1 hypothetical protein SEVIR_8G122900v2 [Setaria viridis]